MSMDVAPISLETVTSSLTGLAPDGGTDQIRTLGDDALDGLGQLSMSTAVPGATPVAAVNELVNSSTTRVTARTPAAGRRIRIVSCQVEWGSTTVQTGEMYFGTGANIQTDETKAIGLKTLDLDNEHSFQFVWPDGAGPVGLADEVLSVRCTVSNGTNLSFLFHTREE